MNYQNKLLRARQAELDWDNQTLAAIAGVTADTVAKLRKGDMNIAYMSLVRVTQALGLTMWDLYKTDAPKETTSIYLEQSQAI